MRHYLGPHIAFSTPYEASFGSTTLTYSTPSIIRLTLSLVIAPGLEAVPV